MKKNRNGLLNGKSFLFLLLWWNIFLNLTKNINNNGNNFTKIKSFDFYQALKNPFSRAAYIMFVISEVHPFIDGNGWIARVMMNVELVKEGHQK